MLSLKWTTRYGKKIKYREHLEMQWCEKPEMCVFMNEEVK